MNERIALGFGNNIDYEIGWDSTVFEELILRHNIRKDELDVNRVIDSERDLVISILSFLELGSGGERFVASSSIIEVLAQRFEKKITLGGTSVRAAIAMRKLGHKSALHLVTINDHVRRLLPQNSPYVCSNGEDSSYPHLIVQFMENTCVTAGDIDIRSSHANRLIYHCDTDNIAMNLNEDFADLITDAEVFLIAGFNAMQSEALLSQRLVSVQKMMASLPIGALVYYEDAGFYNPAFSRLIRSTLAEKINIYSLNEDELQDYLNRRLDLLDVEQIRSALPELHKLIPVPAIVVHTKHWALAYGKDAARLARPLKAATTMATTRYCFGDNFTPANYKAVESLPPTEVNMAFADAINRLPGDHLHCVPVANVGHIKSPLATTVGLGDAFVGGFLPALLA